jgi:hypothetical protein
LVSTQEIWAPATGVIARASVKVAPVGRPVCRPLASVQVTFLP